MVTSSAISDSSTNYGKNVTGNYHVDNSSEDSDSDDEVLAAGPWSEEDEEEDAFIMIPETVTTLSGRVASSVSTVILH